ncbi:MAG: hypothetical protein ACLTY8_13075 [Lachnospiraceae bacterium]
MNSHTVAAQNFTHRYEVYLIPIFIGELLEHGKMEHYVPDPGKKV